MSNMFWVSGRRMFSLIVIILLFVSLSQPAHAIQRSCNARYHVDILTFGNEPVGSPISFNFGDFYARRGCGRRVPNRCRRRARDAAQACMSGAWANRNIPGTPAVCRSNGVREYPLGGLEPVLTSQVCGYLQGRGVNSSQVALDAITSGNKGCGPSESKSLTTRLASNFFINCSRPSISSQASFDNSSTLGDELEDRELEEDLENIENNELDFDKNIEDELFIEEYDFGE